MNPRAVPLIVLALAAGAVAEPWRRHTIDASSRGADGVRMADVNGDGRLDITTGWEEGGVVRVCINPGPAKVRAPWPSVTVGEVASPEDAVFVDLDGDGAIDVVSCCEGRTKSVFVHWAPTDPKRYLDAAAWKTEPFPAVAGKQAWMFCVPMQADGRGGTDLVIGSKGRGGSIGYLECPANPRDLTAWRFHRLVDAGWIMSLRAVDMDGDGDTDILASDRRGPRRGILWLANPGARAEGKAPAWAEHRIGAADKEVMFLATADLNADGRLDVVSATRNGQIVGFLGAAGKAVPAWRPFTIDNPFGIRNGKGVALGDVDLDGRMDIVHTAAPGNDSLIGVTWLAYGKSVTGAKWAVHDIGGPAGVKFDRIELVDLDDDGDLDVITNEERTLNAVFWYENPTRQPRVRGKP